MYILYVSVYMLVHIYIVLFRSFEAIYFFVFTNHFTGVLFSHRVYFNFHSPKLVPFLNLMLFSLVSFIFNMYNVFSIG